MTKKLPDFEVRTGIVPGRSHIKRAVNCQDALRFSGILNNDQPMFVGVVSDGCGEGAHNEVGSNLAVNFITREAIRLLEFNVAPQEVVRLLYPALIDLVGSVLNSIPFSSENDRVEFIRNHLLFTVVGFIGSLTDVVVFWAGDGMFVINDEIFIQEQANKPMYPTYHHINRQFLKQTATPLPLAFETATIAFEELHRLAIGSDAWAAEQDLIHKIWGFKHPHGLQRQMNVWSDKQHRFSDDASIILFEVSRPEPESLQEEAESDTPEPDTIHNPLSEDYASPESEKEG